MTRTTGLLDRWYPERRVGGYTHVDDTVTFYTRINSVLEPTSVLLDLGCGRGAATEDPLPWRRELRSFKGRCARVIGVDPDPDAASNPTIDEFHLVVDGVLPLAASSVDICVSDYVLEHVTDVDSFLAECARVVKPGGYLFVRTPNVWSYMVAASRLVPDRLHSRVLARVQPERPAADVFPTVYRCNSRRALLRALARHGFLGVVQTAEPEPAYLAFSRRLYPLGVFYQRYAPRPFRSMLLAFATRVAPESASHEPESHPPK